MADYDDAVVRAVLREHGQEPPVRGKLGSHWIQEYETIVAGQDGEEPTLPLPDEPGEYDEGVSAADFPDDDEPITPVVEQRPRRVRQSRATRTDQVVGRLMGKPRSGGGKGKGKKKPVPRVPVDRLIGRAWDGLGRVIEQAIPPTGKALQWQAPVAGLILEDIVRDTVADRVLQPVARAEAVAEKGFALVGLPVVVTAMAAAQGLPEDQRAVRMAFLVPLLREIVVMNIRIMGDKAEEIAQRQAEAGPLNARADEIMGMFFAMTETTAEHVPEQETAGV